MASATMILEKLIVPLQRLMNQVKARRTPLTLVLCVIFMVGLVWAVDKLDIALNELNIFPALAIFGLMGPLALVYGAVGLMLLARVAGSKIDFGSAWTIAGYAQLAESLPLPGGAIVRAAALKNAGTGGTKSVLLVTGTAILWVAMASIGAGFALLIFDKAAATLFLISGFSVLIPITWWIVSQAGMSIAAQILLHRGVGLMLMTVRLSLAFMIINQAVPFTTALFFSFANIAGSASAISPAGLGVGEMIAAFLASMVSISAASAFLAIALNRILGLAACISLVAAGSLSHKIQLANSSLFKELK